LSKSPWNRRLDEFDSIYAEIVASFARGPELGTQSIERLSGAMGCSWHRLVDEGRFDGAADDRLLGCVLYCSTLARVGRVLFTSQNQRKALGKWVGVGLAFINPVVGAGVYAINSHSRPNRDAMREIYPLTSRAGRWLGLNLKKYHRYDHSTKDGHERFILNFMRDHGPLSGGDNAALLWDFPVVLTAAYIDFVIDDDIEKSCRLIRRYRDLQSEIISVVGSTIRESDVGGEISRGIAQVYSTYETLFKDLADGNPSNDPTLRTALKELIQDRSVISQTATEDSKALKDLRQTALQEAQSEFRSIVGLRSVKNEIKQIADSIQYRRKRRELNLTDEAAALHFVFTGNPGTGKTTVARLLGKVLFGLGAVKTAKFTEADRSALVGEYVGHTATKVDRLIQKSLDGVLFIDEAYSLVQSDNDIFGREAVDALLKRMEDYRDRLVVIIAGYPALIQKFLKSNPGLQSRFTRQLQFSDYSPDEMLKIFKELATKRKYQIDDDALQVIHRRLALAFKSRDENFGNGRFVREMFEQTISTLSTNRRKDNLTDATSLCRIQLCDVSPRTSQRAERENNTKRRLVLEEAMAELDHLVGLRQVKAEIAQTATFLRVQSERRANGLKSINKGMHFVFQGNPGTGKTTVARIFARILFGIGMIERPTVIEADRSNLVAKYIGQTAVTVDEIVKKALGGVLFIDEAYSLTNSHPEWDFGKEAIEVLLKRMEDHRDRLVVIAAGYPVEMEAFVNANPGLRSRFTTTLHFEDYTVDELCEIVLRLTDDNQYSVSDDAMTQIRKAFETLCRAPARGFGNARVARNLFDEIITKHSVRLSLNPAASIEDLSTIYPEDIPVITPTQ